MNNQATKAIRAVPAPDQIAYAMPTGIDLRVNDKK